MSYLRSMSNPQLLEAERHAVARADYFVSIDAGEAFAWAAARYAKEFDERCPEEMFESLLQWDAQYGEMIGSG